MCAHACVCVLAYLRAPPTTSLSALYDNVFIGLGKVTNQQVVLHSQPKHSLWSTNQRPPDDEEGTVTLDKLVPDLGGQ